MKFALDMRLVSAFLKRFMIVGLIGLPICYWFFEWRDAGSDELNLLRLPALPITRSLSLPIEDNKPKVTGGAWSPIAMPAITWSMPSAVEIENTSVANDKKDFRRIMLSASGFPVEVLFSIDAALEFFKVKQNADGSWGEGTDRPRVTAMVLLTMLHAGYFPGESGVFPKSMQSGFAYLNDKTQLNQWISEGSCEGAAWGVMAHAEAYRLSQGVLGDSVGRKLAENIMQTQNRLGGWSKAGSGEEFHGWNSAWMVIAIKIAERCGLISNNTTQQTYLTGISVIKSSTGDYRSSNTTGDNGEVDAQASVATALAQMWLGYSPDAPKIRSTIQRIFNRYGECRLHKLSGGGKASVSCWYATIQLAQWVGGDSWSHFSDGVKDKICMVQSGEGDLKGGWSERFFHDENSDVAATAWIVLILQTPYSFVEIRQRQDE